MRISVNGKSVEIGTTRLSETLTELGYTDDFIATAVNEEFVPSSARAGYELNNGDRIEILSPMQGG
ncbi:MAG: sulfur carrier protein ThiS [Rhodobacteraceae bacterium]|nr:sulfur carrier protein ThiS [Paracoccaceae bacterium]